jgi:two-component system sensor histidine kinase HydH
MSLELGVSNVAPGAPLSRRLAWLSAARLLLLLLLLLLITAFFGPEPLGVNSFTSQVAVVTLALAFALAGVYATLLRSGRFIHRLVDVQLILDQVTWTVLVYLSGGAASGATSLYGLTCIAGATLTGLRGAGLAALAGGGCFTALALALQSGLLLPPPDQPPQLYRLTDVEVAYYGVLTGLALVVVTMLSGYLAERLRLTGGQLEEARLRADRAERMAALGRLAGGLAHEIRNPLGSIAGSIRLLKTGSGLTDEDRELCDIVEREAARLDDLVTDMVDLTRARPPELTEVDAAQVAQDVVALASRSGRAGSDVEVVYRGVESALIRADAAQLRQLVWNLMRNGVQASSAGDTVTVTLEIHDGTALLLVEDRGIGIDEEAREQIFDAFFTTRSKGTGVGLAVVKRIADEHRFAIDVSSEQGEGARFAVRLGRVLRSADQDLPPSSADEA